MIQGVALLLFDNLHRLCIIRELSSRPAYGKTAGQLSPPMETLEEGEVHPIAVYRLIQEEVGPLSMVRDIKFFRTFWDILPESCIHVYIGRCIKSFGLMPIDNDVQLEGWLKPHVFLRLSREKKRLGAHEIVHAYVRGT